VQKLLHRLLFVVAGFCVAAGTASAQQLEIHYIDVGWGGSVLVKGPNGTTVLMDGGNTGQGTASVVPYLKSIGIQPANGLDYTIASHQHCDHIGGLDEVVNAGYNVHTKNYYNGSAYSTSCATQWTAAAGSTTAGAPAVAAAGQQIPLGNGAMLTIVAVNGHIIGGGTVTVSDENDRSIAVLIQYGGFDYLWAGDLGGGSIDTSCTGRSTTQVDVETPVITAISPGGAHPLISAGGIDVLHVNHHGSESSTNMNYMNKAQPAVAIIGVGDGESVSWDLPRVDVVDHVLRAEATSCITAPPAFVLQTEEGNPAGSLTSFTGFSVGNITVATDGATAFTVSADGHVHQGPNELASSGLPRTFALDDVAPPPAGLDISGWQLVQANASYTFTLPAGTVIPANGYVVVGRDATKTAFQSFWGVTLPANAVYVNAASLFPVINGSETYMLKTGSGVTIDGATIAMSASGGQSLQRKDPCMAAGSASSWNILAASAGTPGSGAGVGCGKGVVINEFSDALGTGNYVYEFVELHYDQ
jgi:beta-lactamase superfamily II metal-dependent hydrolase